MKCVFLVLALCLAGASAGFCDTKGSSGWYCDGATTRKYCSCELDCDRRRMSAADNLEVDHAIAMNDRVNQEEADTSAFLDLLEKDDATTETRRRRVRSSRSFSSRRSYYSRFSRRSISCKWKCEKGAEFNCENGCATVRNNGGGACKSNDMVCGTAWAKATAGAAGTAAPTSQTCSAVFTATDVGGTKKKNDCILATAGVGDAAICPVGDTTFGMPSPYVPWKNVQSSAANVKARLEASALDAQWFRDVLFQRMYLPVDVKQLKDNVTHPLHANVAEIEANLVKVKAGLTTYFNSQKQNFISFSCMRNIPQCSMNKGSTPACESKCNAVSVSVKGFQKECEKMFNNTVDKTYTKLSFVGGKPNAAQDNQIFACRPLGYVEAGEYVVYERDCDGTNPDAEYPGLCIQFQNDHIKAELDAMSTGGSSANTPFLGLTAVFAAVAMFLSR